MVMMGDITSQHVRQGGHVIQLHDGKKIYIRLTSHGAACNVSELHQLRERKRTSSGKKYNVSYVRNKIISNLLNHTEHSVQLK
jgi:hypothetical protein